MGALCCAHNRQSIGSTDEEQGLTTAAEDEIVNNEPELEYPENQQFKIAGQSDSDLDEDINDIKQDHFICDSIKNCQCILNIEQIMKFYISWISEHHNNANNKKNNVSIINRIKDKKDKTKKTIYWYIHKRFGETYHQYNYSNITLINDFNHILFKHNNKMDIILKNINAKKLFNENINDFIIERNINKDINNNNIYFGFEEIKQIITQQLCDKIYCFIFNNIYINKTVNEQKDKEEKDNKEDDIYNINDYEYIKTNKQLIEIQNKYKYIKDKYYKNENKFCISFDRCENVCDVFKYKYYYWIYYKNNDEYKHWFINSKYLTLKTLCLEYITLMEFNLLFTSATNYIDSNYCKYNMICNTNEYETQYKICKDDYITVSHIITILLYCNYNAFRNELLKTYYKININETDNELKLRHCNFAFIGKCLTELIECFGIKMNGNGNGNDNYDNYYYHCINENVLFGSKIIDVMCPFSITNKYEIAYINCDNNNGLVLELSYSNCDNININNYFDCKWISDFVFENEKLLLNGKNALELNTIYSISNGLCSDYTIYLNALVIIKELIGGKLYKYEDENNMNKILQIVVQRLITNKIYTVYADSLTDLVPIYIQNITNFYFSTLHKANINYKSIIESEENGGYKFLEKLLLKDNLSFINVDIFKSLFPDLNYININFIECNKDEYKMDSNLFQYILLHLTSLHKFNEIQILLPSNYDEQILTNTINEYVDKFNKLNWKLKRESYQNTITISNNKASMSFAS